jgi:hypothetical protein
VSLANCAGKLDDLAWSDTAEPGPSTVSAAVTLAPASALTTAAKVQRRAAVTLAPDGAGHCGAQRGRPRPGRRAARSRRPGPQRRAAAALTAAVLTAAAIPQRRSAVQLGGRRRLTTAPLPALAPRRPGRRHRLTARTSRNAGCHRITLVHPGASAGPCSGGPPSQLGGDVGLDRRRERKTTWSATVHLAGGVDLASRPRTPCVRTVPAVRRRNRTAVYRRDTATGYRCHSATAGREG